MKGQISLRGVFVCAVLASCLSAGVFAQQPGEDWTRIAILGIGTRVVVLSPTYTLDGIIFAGTEGLGVWRSMDDGDTWVQSTSDESLAHSCVADLVISPHFPSATTGDHTLFAITTDGAIYKCTDGHTTPFTFSCVMEAPLGAVGTSLAIHPLYDGTGTGSNLYVFAGYQEGPYPLYITSNGGTTWGGDVSSTLPGHLIIYDLAFSPSSGSGAADVFVGGNAVNTLPANSGPVWERTGTGTSGTWTKRSGADPMQLGSGDSETVTTLLYPGSARIWAGTLTHGMWLSTDTGGTWSAGCDGDKLGTLPRVNAIARSSGSSPHMIEGRDDRPYRSINSGANCTGWLPATPVWDVEFHPSYNGTTNCGILYATPNGLFRKSCSALDRGPAKVDGRAVAMAHNGDGKFMGSAGQGLFKSVPVTGTPYPMVRYNNFPGKRIPQIVAICPSPNYSELNGTCAESSATVFVAANFPGDPSYNGVYKSTNFGATWALVDRSATPATWPAGDTVYDFAIAPLWPADISLFAATTTGLWCYVSDSQGWTKVNDAGWMGPVWSVGIPPTYDRRSTAGFPYNTIFVGLDYGSPSLKNTVWYTNNNGSTWTKTDWDGATKLFGRATDFTFQDGFGISGNRVYASAISNTSPAGTGGVIKCIGGSGGNFATGWTSYNTGLGTSPMVWGIAAEPQFYTGGSYDSICATDSGVFKATSYNPIWTIKDTRPAWSVAYDQGDTSGNTAIVGFQNDTGVRPGGAALVTFAKTSFTVNTFTGYGTLPDDVWSTVAHDRDSNVLFSASPSMGVFVSEDAGISYRPWNRGMGDPTGPCVLRSGVGISMLAGRRNPAGGNNDIVWAGTAATGIKARWIYYNSTTGLIDLETENGSTANGWRDCSWLNESGVSQGTLATGRFERIQALPGTAQTYPVWAASPDLGMFELLAGPYWSIWKRQNSSAWGTNPPAKGVRHGDDGTDAVRLSSGAPVTDTVTSAALQSGWKYYSINVSSGAHTLYCYLRDLANDPDLYVRYNALPTTSTYDYRPNLHGLLDESVCVKALLLENFEEAWGPYGDNPPPGWTVSDTVSPSTWDTNDWYRAYWGAPYGIVAFITGYPSESQNNSLISPTFNLPAGKTTYTLEYDHDFQRGASEYGRIWYKSTQHPSWTLQKTYSASTTGWVHDSISLFSYAGDTNAQVCFQYAGLNGNFWALDNIRVAFTDTPNPIPLSMGTWYIGVNGYPVGTSQYELTATLDGCAATASSPPSSQGLTPEKWFAASDGENVPSPKAPTGNTTWGTVNEQGVFKGIGTSLESGPSPEAISWVARNGATPHTLGNLHANTVIQLTDQSLVVGCEDDVYYSPAPDEGITTWLSATANVANAGSNHFRDLLECSNGDVLIAANGTGTGGSAGGVWLSGDKGAHWMKISSGFDDSSQNLEDIVADSGNPPSYYASTDSTGVYTRTITAYPYPIVTSLVPNTGSVTGNDTITINGSNFMANCPTGLDCPDSNPVVLFGDTEVSATYLGTTQLRVTSPAHVTGAVGVAVRNPDTRLSSSKPAFTYACTQPTAVTNNGASDPDPYAFSGIQINWSQDPVLGDSGWKDGEFGTRTYSVLRGGTVTQSGIAYGTVSTTDTPPIAVTSYAYTVRYVNGCSFTRDTAGYSAMDDAEAAGQTLTYMKWNASGKNRLDWGATSGADAYKLYRGDSSQLKNLPTNASVCLAYQGAGVSTGATLTAVPASGTFYWYLVVATKGPAEGTLGTGTGGTQEKVTSSGLCSPP